MRSKNTLFIAVVAMFVCAVMTAQSAVAAHMYVLAREGGTPGGAADGDTVLRQVTPVPFSVTSVGNAVGERLSGLDFQPGTNTLYASSGSGGTNPRSLFTVDTGTGAATLVGATGQTIYEIAFNRTSGALYGNSYDDLYSINVGTGAATIIGSFGFGNIESIAVDPTSGTLYGLTWDNAELYTIDPGTGAATSVGVFAGLDAAEAGRGISGLGIDYSGNFFATIGSNGGNVYALDTSDFSATFLGDASLDRSVTDVAFLVPEPTGIALALLGLTFSCVRTRRKR